MNSVPNIAEHYVTDEKYYLTRRRFIQATSALAIGLSAYRQNYAESADQADLPNVKTTDYGKGLKPNSYKEITNYNNFYEFGTGKRDPARNAHTLKPKPWHVKVSGECAKTGEFDLEDFIKPHQLEERIYRFRCVEAWSMVIPWVGVPLADVLKTFEPNANAKYVQFTTLYDPVQMPFQKRPILKWPYIEGLTIAEAMHPLSLLVVGLYGKVLPNQNGAPLRLIVPWKYGFKGIKSIVDIRFTRMQPISSWMRQAPNEYGFYANVNPAVDHPRWSQKTERVIGKGSFLKPERRKTELFNSYQEQVAHLYSGLDLTRHF